MTFSSTTRRGILAAFVAIVAFSGAATAQEQRRFYMPPAPGTVHGVPAQSGMVVAQEKLAARIGADILRQGGNAVDAAVATGFAMAVSYPRAGNIGGGGFMVIHLAERHEDVAIDYRETAPGAMTRDIFLGTDGKPDADKSYIDRITSVFAPYVDQLREKQQAKQLTEKRQEILRQKAKQGFRLHK